MTRTTRRILFYCAIGVFIGISYIVLVYAQGYQYSFSEGKFIRSGALYLNANTSASILINGKLKTSTSLLGNSASIGGLLPATYTVSVQKEGWSSWQKKVTITAGFVEDFSHVMLLPQIGQDKENIKQEIHDLLYPMIASSSVDPSLSRSPSPTPTPKKKNLPPCHRRPLIELNRIILITAHYMLTWPMVRLSELPVMLRRYRPMMVKNWRGLVTVSCGFIGLLTQIINPFIMSATSRLSPISPTPLKVFAGSATMIISPLTLWVTKLLK